jgi:hypothetical protein
MKIQANKNLPLYQAIIATLLLHFITLAGCCEDMEIKQQEAKAIGNSVVFAWAIAYCW